MPFEFKATSIPDVILVTASTFVDERGFFAEQYKASAFKAGGIDFVPAQVNRSCSKKDVLRGLHYQLNPKAQAKLVGVLRGEIFDVAVDIRRGSPTYGQWAGARLSGDNHKMLYIPIGFAHGFCALSDEVDIQYYCSGEYAPELERNILWDDPQIRIDWPITSPRLSPRDAGGRCLKEAENNFFY